ncbi:phage tail assembly chaperone G [Priestia megaterium]|uniref:phage tail assembly chaperone G n=1 Tax=Priestia megaterium TaxID=1404 RepID=UPI002D7F8A20|nr:hypothetical protein [Priestia megaterium]MEB4861157.1 hypothetical protein [Priestia megaterium]
MNLTLEIDDKKVKFGKPKKVKGRAYLRYLEMKQYVDFNNPTPDELDELVQMICDAYENKFTIDEFYDGCYIDPFSGEGFFGKITEFLYYIQGIDLKKVQKNMEDLLANENEVEKKTP